MADGALFPAQLCGAAAAEGGHGEPPPSVTTYLACPVVAERSEEVTAFGREKCLAQVWGGFGGLGGSSACTQDGGLIGTAAGRVRVPWRVSWEVVGMVGGLAEPLCCRVHCEVEQLDAFPDVGGYAMFFHR